MCNKVAANSHVIMTRAGEGHIVSTSEACKMVRSMGRLPTAEAEIKQANQRCRVVAC